MTDSCCEYTQKKNTDYCKTNRFFALLRILNDQPITWYSSANKYYNNHLKTPYNVKSKLIQPSVQFNFIIFYQRTERK